MHKTVIITSEVKKRDIKPGVRILPLGTIGWCSLGSVFVDFFTPLALLGCLPDCVGVRFAIKNSYRYSSWFKDYLVDHLLSDVAKIDHLSPL